MISRSNTFVALVPLVVAVMFVGLIFFGYKAWVAIPDSYVVKAQVFANAIANSRKSLDNKIARFDAYKSTVDWNFLAPYSERELWMDDYAAAKESLNKAAELNRLTIIPILQKNHKDDVSALAKALRAGDKLLDDVRKRAANPASRIVLLLDGRKNKDKFYTESLAIEKATTTRVNAFLDLANDLVNRHPHKNEDIQQKKELLNAALSVVRDDLSVITREHNSRATDFALYADTYKKINISQTELMTLADKLSSKLAELDKSYVKVLSDMRVENFIRVGRADWCEGEYCGPGNTITYPPVQVDDDTFEFFDEFRGDLIAKEGWGWGSRFNKNVPDSRWNALKIIPSYRRDRGNNYAEYWIQDAEQRTYHKYTIIENGSVKEMDWERVKNDLFRAHEEDLGLAIATKPFGFYEEETINSAEPVGMATIASPTIVNGVPTGSNQYGEWRQSNGHSFWHYYGMYRMLGDFIAPRGYSYSDWDGYRSRDRGKPYYGDNDQYGTYGHATYSGSRYRNSEYAKRNPSVHKEAMTGRKSLGSSTIRGAGPAGRGKGPSGGGK